MIFLDSFYTKTLLYIALLTVLFISFLQVAPGVLLPQSIL